jgi:hypothetical protein
MSAFASRIAAWLGRPTDVAGLAAFRVLFGLLMFASTVRFVANGWVREFFLEPDFQFHYWGFDWVAVLPPWAMYGAVGALAVLSLCIAAGLFYRLSALLFFLLFTYVELIDVTYYLNHYYLVSLLSLLLVVLPLHRAYSIDVWRKPELRASTLPAAITYLLRFQVGVVYFYAAIAKLGPDWLLHGQPLGIWLAARTDTPIIGPLLDHPSVALVMSWSGFLYDLTIVLFLSWRRTRPYAFLAVVAFHGLTGLLFNIGMFPYIMTIAATVFFAPDWPRQWIRRARAIRRRGLEKTSRPSEPEVATLGPTRRFMSGGRSKLCLGLGIAFCLVQLLVPLRSLAYGDNVLWHEQGMRWAWKVMVREKNGSVTYRVKRPGAEREQFVSPSRYLSSNQEREMSAQPDLILQLAHHIAEEYAQHGIDGVEVRVDARASLNGRPPARLIDPDVDLTEISDGVLPAPYIRPAPGGAPPQLKRPTTMVRAEP